jgi:hypothetical protein
MPTGVPEKTGQRDVSAFGVDLTSATPSGRPIGAGLMGKGGGACT